MRVEINLEISLLLPLPLLLLLNPKLASYYIYFSTRETFLSLSTTAPLKTKLWKKTENTPPPLPTLHAETPLYFLLLSTSPYSYIPVILQHQCNDNVGSGKKCCRCTCSCLLPILSFWKYKYIFWTQLSIYFLLHLYFFGDVSCFKPNQLSGLGQYYKLFSWKVYFLLVYSLKVNATLKYCCWKLMKKRTPLTSFTSEGNTATCHAKPCNTRGNTDQEEKRHIITPWTFQLVCIALCKQTLHRQFDCYTSTLKLFI